MIIKNLPAQTTTANLKGGANESAPQHDQFASELKKQLSSGQQSNTQQSEQPANVSHDVKKKPVENKEQQSDGAEPAMAAGLTDDMLATLVDNNPLPTDKTAADALLLQGAQTQQNATPDTQGLELPEIVAASASVPVGTPDLDAQSASVTAQIDASLANSSNGNSNSSGSISISISISGMIMPAKDKPVLPHGPQVQTAVARTASDAKAPHAEKTLGTEPQLQPQKTTEAQPERTEQPASFGNSVITAIHNTHSPEQVKVQNIMQSAPVVVTQTPQLTEPAAGVVTGTLQANVGTTAWQQSLGQQIAVFSREGIHRAELRLHPEDLGALQISLKVTNDQAQVHFVAESQQVRSALESAIPHLRTMLAESGIQLGQSSVGADTASSFGSSESGDSSGQRNFGHETGEQDISPEDERNIQPVVVKYTSGINTFA